MALKIRPEGIVKTEARWAIHIKEKPGVCPDLHYIKLVSTLTDGTQVPHIRLVKNFERPYWITKPTSRNHKEKKEFEELENLTEFSSTESNLNRNIANALGVPHEASNPSVLKSNPYIYGADLSSTALIKQHYLTKNNFVQSKYSVAVLDIETGVLESNKDEILLISVTMRDKIFISCLESFVEKAGDVQYRVKNTLAKYLPNYKDIPFNLVICKTEVDVIKQAFKTANEWAPDILAIWNQDFDIPFILKRLKKFKVNPIDVLCDLSIPRDFRLCYYKKGMTSKLTASGVFHPMSMASQWHTLYLTARFYILDAMCAYKHIRLSKAEETSYSLDNILKVEGIGGKLRIPEAEQYTGLVWHKFMQTNYKIEYIVYCIYDSLSINELDDKTGDLCSVLPSFSGISDFSKFNSNPKKIADAMYMFARKKGRILGVVGKKMEDIIEDDDEYADNDDDEEDTNVNHHHTLGLKGWIVMLQAHMLLYEGLRIFEDMPWLVTNLRGIVMDVDVTAAYPNATVVGNVSKETTLTEVISIGNLLPEMFNEQSLGLIVGSANSIEYSTKMLGLCNLIEMKELIRDQLESETLKPMTL